MKHNGPSAKFTTRVENFALKCFSGEIFAVKFFGGKYFAQKFFSGLNFALKFFDVEILHLFTKLYK